MMKRTYTLSAALAVASGGALFAAAQNPAPGQSAPSRSVLSTANDSGELRTIFTNGGSLDLTNPFFKSKGTNGRSCVSCHVPGDGWTITPAHVQARFNATQGLDPIFSTFDGSNSPLADVSTVAARRGAYSMLLNKGLIRIGMPIPAGAEFELTAADDPYGYASSGELSLFRRPMPTANLRFLTGVMWDARFSATQTGTFPIKTTASDADNATALFNNLKRQSNEATIGHAQAGIDLTDAERIAIVNFEMTITMAQQTDKTLGLLDANGAQAGVYTLAAAPFYVTINDVLGADHFGNAFDSSAMKMYQNWIGSPDPHRAQVARGSVLFNTKPIRITGVNGLNDALGLPVINGFCTTCHDTPSVGNHSVALPINIGLTDASRRTADLPLYTLRNKATGEIVQTTDPGRAMTTGKWADIGKFKGPTLRGLAARAPYFHNGLAARLEDAVDFYDTRFNIGFSAQEKADLAAFLKTL